MQSPPNSHQTTAAARVKAEARKSHAKRHAVMKWFFFPHFVRFFVKSLLQIEYCPFKSLG